MPSNYPSSEKACVPCAQVSCVIDESLHIVMANQPFFALVNTSQEECVGMPLYKVLNLPLKSALLRAVFESMETFSIQETSTDLGNSKHVQWQVSATPGENGMARKVWLNGSVTRNFCDLAKEEAERQKEKAAIAKAIAEKERKLISFELHDNVNQLLSLSSLLLDVVSPTNDKNFTLVKQSREYVLAAINEIRHISHRLNPPALYHNNISEALEDAIEKLNLSGRIKVHFDSNLPFMDAEIPQTLQLTMFRIAQEQLNNIMKHAEATTVSVKLWRSAKEIHLQITDNGKGFDTNKQRAGLGLNNIFSRVEQYKGKVRLQTNPGEGCTLEAIIPQPGYTA